MAGNQSLMETLKSFELQQIRKEPFTQYDISTIFKSLESEDQRIVLLAGQIATGLSKPLILELLKRIEYLPQRNQKTLLPCLAATDHFEVYRLLFKLLKASTDEEMNFRLEYCIARSEYYGVLPLIIDELRDDDIRFREKIKRVLVRMGFKKIAPHLAVFPVIPHERVFREAFGDMLIDRLYQDI